MSNKKLGVQSPAPVGCMSVSLGEILNPELLYVHDCGMCCKVL